MESTPTPAGPPISFKPCMLVPTPLVDSIKVIIEFVTDYYANYGQEYQADISLAKVMQICDGCMNVCLMNILEIARADIMGNLDEVVVGMPNLKVKDVLGRPYDICAIRRKKKEEWWDFWSRGFVNLFPGDEIIFYEGEEPDAWKGRCGHLCQGCVSTYPDAWKERCRCGHLCRGCVSTYRCGFADGHDGPHYCQEFGHGIPKECFHAPPAPVTPPRKKQKRSQDDSST